MSEETGGAINYIRINDEIRPIQDSTARNDIAILSGNVDALSSSLNTSNNSVADILNALNAAKEINLLKKNNNQYEWNVESSNEYIAIGSIKKDNNQNLIEVLIYKDGILNTETVYYTIDIYNMQGERVDGTAATLNAINSFSKTTNVKTGNFIVKIFNNVNKDKLLCCTNLLLSEGISGSSTSSSGSSGAFVDTTEVHYALSINGSSPPTDDNSWKSVVAPEKGKYIWSRTTLNLTDGRKQYIYSVNYIGTDGANGTNGQDAISVQITSSNGNIFRQNGQVDTILTCTVFSGSTDITDKVSSFTWKRYNKDGVLEETYSPSLHGRNLQISNANIFNKATFNCEVEINI